MVKWGLRDASYWGGGHGPKLNKRLWDVNGKDSTVCGVNNMSERTWRSKSRDFISGVKGLCGHCLSEEGRKLKIKKRSGRTGTEPEWKGVRVNRKNLVWKR